jgi:hypothetical protein
VTVIAKRVDSGKSSKAIAMLRLRWGPHPAFFVNFALCKSQEGAALSKVEGPAQPSSQS